MIDSLYLGMSGLSAFSRGLRVIANNTTNLNTPGFKSATLQFADAAYANTAYSGQQFSQLGYGVNTTGTSLSFKAGELRQTTNDLDVAVDGQGMFTLMAEDGSITYSRAGQFELNPQGVLVNPSKARVMGIDSARARCHGRRAYAWPQVDQHRRDDSR
jgi:flagellar hook protein FlgE